MSDWKQLISKDVKAGEAALIELRRQIHRHPELGHQEKKTQSLVLKFLEEAGIQAEPCGTTGVVGHLQGSEEGPTLLLRADMDALPICEESKHDFASCEEGVMHACGHDAHTAIMLMTAKILSKRGIERGRVLFVFQPAEEGLGGARSMIDAGVLDGEAPDAALAFHVWSPFPTGTVVALDGPIMASVDGFSIRITGRGVHAATPEGGADPIMAASQIISAAQTLVSRRTAPIDPVVLSFTSIHGGTSFNIIPPEVEIKGTFRTFDKRVRDGIKAELMEQVDLISRAMGTSASFEFFEALSPTVNDPRIAGLVREEATELVGADNTLTIAPLMVGEDFGLFLERIPGAMILLGCGNQEKGIVYPHHHPLFDVDEDVLPLAVELALGFVARFFGKKGVR